MKIITELREALTNAENFEKVKTYNFVRHNCSVKNAEIKIPLKYRLSIVDEKDFDILGYCEHCKTIFHNEDFE